MSCFRFAGQLAIASGILPGLILAPVLSLCATTAHAAPASVLATAHTSADGDVAAQMAAARTRAAVTDLTTGIDATDRAAHLWHLAHLRHEAHLRYLARLSWLAQVARADAAVRHQAATRRASAPPTAPASTGPTATTVTVATTGGSPRGIAEVMLDNRGEGGQWGCLDALWNFESGWNVYAANPGTGAYGIPQALPGSKMAVAGPDWQGDAATQIRWGLAYIGDIYGTPCAAWAHDRADGWY